MNITKEELLIIINEEYKNLLKEERRDNIVKQYNSLSLNEQKECQLLEIKLYSSLYESGFVNKQQMSKILILEQEMQEAGSLTKSIGGKIMKNAGDALMGPAGFILKKLGIVNNPLDYLKLILDVLGFFPAAGEIADLINLAIALLEKDLIGVALNAISLIPTLGDAIAKPIKWLLKAGKGVPLKYVQKILPALQKYAPGLIKRLTDFMKKFPLDNVKKQKVIELATKAFKTAEEFFAKYLTGSADDIAKNIGDKGAKYIKVKTAERNKMRAADREAKRAASGRMTAADAASKARKIGQGLNTVRRLVGKK